MNGNFGLMLSLHKQMTTKNAQHFHDKGCVIMRIVKSAKKVAVNT